MAVDVFIAQRAPAQGAHGLDRGSVVQFGDRQVARHLSHIETGATVLKALN
jgi:hypothetical protein